MDDLDELIRTELRAREQQIGSGLPLAAVHAGIARRAARRRRRLVLGSAAGLVAVVGAVAALVGLPTREPPAARLPASPGVDRSGPDWSDPFSLGVRFGWTSPGVGESVARSGKTTRYLTYLTDDVVVEVFVYRPGAANANAMRRGSPVRLGAKRGYYLFLPIAAPERELGDRVAWEYRPGAWVTVSASSARGDPRHLRPGAETATALRVARTLRIGTGDRLHLPFRLDYVPPGLPLQDTGSQVAPAPGPQAPLQGWICLDSRPFTIKRRACALDVDVWPGVGSKTDYSPKPDRVVAGHPAVYMVKDGVGWLVLFDVDGRGGVAVVDSDLSVQPHPEAMLTRVAEGLRIVPHDADPRNWTDRPLG